MYHSSTPPSHSSYHSMSTINGIQGRLLEVTVVGCSKLKDTEWISRQDPYVFVEYASTKFRTRTCTDGGKNPTFQEKFTFTLIEGLRELNVVVWNSNTVTYDDFIGSGKVQLQKVLSEGYDDSAWPLHTKTGRHAGEVKLILHYANANKPAKSYAPSAPPYVAPSAPQVPLYSTPLPASTAPYPSLASAYPAPSPASAYPTPSPASAYPAPSPYNSYSANSAAYPPAPYPPPQPAAYPSPYPPPSAYPPQQYPPPPQASQYYPPGPYRGIYPPPPY